MKPGSAWAGGGGGQHHGPQPPSGALGGGGVCSSAPLRDLPHPPWDLPQQGQDGISKWSAQSWGWKGLRLVSKDGGRSGRRGKGGMGRSVPREGCKLGMGGSTGILAGTRTSRDPACWLRSDGHPANQNRPVGGKCPWLISTLSNTLHGIAPTHHNAAQPPACQQSLYAPPHEPFLPDSPHPPASAVGAGASPRATP